MGNPTKKGKKTKPHVIPYSRFTKLIIYYLGDITIFTKGLAANEGGKKKTTPKANKPVKPAPAKQAKPATAKQPRPKPVKEKSTKHEEQDQLEAVPEPQVAGEEYDLERVIKMSLDLGTRLSTSTEEASTEPSTQPQDDTSANIVCEAPSPADAKTGTDTEKTVELDEGQAGSDPIKTLESRPPPDNDKMDEDQARPDTGKSHVALAGPNPEPMHNDFVATIYPKVHESLKILADEHVILEDPPSSSRILSSMKNLDNTYTFRD
nr:hypothetical protein [Tanacetum cinerariifolium]